MEHKTQARYPASSDVVIAMYTDNGFHERKMQALGIDFEILEGNFDGDQLHIKTRRNVPVDAKGLAAKFMPSTTVVVNDERWRQSDKSGAVSVSLQGVPLEMSATAQMTDDGDECVITYNWTITAKLPIGGGKLEKFVANDMGDREAKEHETAIEMLDDYR